MNSVYRLQPKHQEILNILNSLNILLSSNSQEMPTWEVLRATRSLQMACKSHSALIREYQNELSSTHWIVSTVLSIMLEKSRLAEQRTNRLNNIVRRCVTEHSPNNKECSRQHLSEMTTQIQTTLELEEMMAYPILDILGAR